jgi:alpha-1,3-rhamnosyltransferase
MLTENDPLVSIIVITYNSSKYVIETLESVKTQTYKNIELIISDDCSVDNTVEICRSWLTLNKDRFARFLIITVDINSGISANCNRGFSAASGKWLKATAGDDLLLPDAIENFVKYVSNSDAEVIISQYKIFSDQINLKPIIFPGENLQKEFFLKEANDQLSLLKRKVYPLIIGLFISKKAFISAGGYDENYRRIEDIPFIIRISKAGYKFYYLPKITVLYRRHSGSLTQSIHSKVAFDPRFLKESYKIYLDIYRKNCHWIDRIFADLSYWCKFNLIFRFNIKSKILIFFILWTPIYLNPNTYLGKLKSKIKIRIANR